MSSLAEPIGEYDRLTAKREALAARLSPAAKAQAFPQIYAKPLPRPDDAAQAKAEVKALKARVRDLEHEVFHKQKIIDALVLEKTAISAQSKVASVGAVVREFCAALEIAGIRCNGDIWRPELMQSARRGRAYAKPRHVCYWLCVQLTRASLPMIGHALGGRDHTSIMHGRDKAPIWMADDPQLKAAADVVLAKFQPSEKAASPDPDGGEK